MEVYRAMIIIFHIQTFFFKKEEEKGEPANSLDRGQVTKCVASIAIIKAAYN